MPEHKQMPGMSYQIISQNAQQAETEYTYFCPYCMRKSTVRSMVVFCPAGCKRINFRALSVYSTTLSPACFRGFQSKRFKRKNSGAGTFGSDNTNQRKAKAFRGNYGTGVLVDAAAHLQVYAEFRHGEKQKGRRVWR